MQQSSTRSTSTLDAEGDELQTVKGKRIASPRKRRRSSDRGTSKLGNGHSGLQGDNSLLNPVKQSTREQSTDDDSPPQRNSAGNDRERLGVENLSEQDKESYSLIHKRALSMLNPARPKKFFWSEEADR